MTYINFIIYISVKMVVYVIWHSLFVNINM